MSTDHFTGSGIARIPDFQLTQYAFQLAKPELKDCHPAALEYIKEQIEKESLAPYYFYLYNEYLPKGTIEWNEELYQKLTAVNQTEIKKIASKIEKIEQEEQEEELLKQSKGEVSKKVTKKPKSDDDDEFDKVNALIKLGEYYAKIGDRENAVSTLRKAFELSSSSTGVKIDILLTMSRIGFFYQDLKYIKDILKEVEILVEKGGDWERKNRFKTYYGIYLISIRDFEKASNLLIDCLATFTSVEVATYENIAILSVLSGLLTLKRSDLKKKILNSPEILSLVNKSDELKLVMKLSNSLYYAKYQELFPTLSLIYDNVLISNNILNPHAKYYLRELRRKAYSQLLESYKALSLKSMANQFGVSQEFLDDDLCKFIPNKKLNCIIDKVNGIVQTNRPDNKNSQYQLLIKQGDALLTKLQKHGAAVKLSGATINAVTTNTTNTTPTSA